MKRRERWQWVRRILRHRTTRVVALAGTLSMVGLGTGVAWGSWTRACAGQSCPSIREFDRYTPAQSIKFYAADGRLIQDLGQSRTVLPLSEMSIAIPAAFLAIEDKRFYQHHGIDIIRFFGALRTNILQMEYAEGFSSITQQLARNIFSERLPSEKAISRKVREMQVALELERTYPKERILELYLNQIFLGGPAYGVEAASQRYFGKSAREVNVAEAATLAAMTQRPNAFDPRRYPEAITRRRNLVITLMREQGYLTEEEADYWKAYPLRVSTRENYAGIAPYFVEWVRRQLIDRLGSSMYEKGYRVYTTLDLDMQIAAEQALEDQLELIEAGYPRGPGTFYQEYPWQTYQQYLESVDGRPGKLTDTPYLQGSLVTLDTNGYVRAMVGGRHFEESEFNRATQADRQPGSTFKPFVYSAAIRAGIPASHIIDDAPISIMNNDSMPWEPENYEQDFRGPMTLRQGLRRSRNLVAIKLGLELGVQTVLGEARAYGISTPIPEVPSMFIGSGSVRNIEMVSAYTAFATLGLRAQPLGILRVEDANGNIVLEPQVRRHRVMDREHEWIMTNMLSDVVRRGTGYRPIRERGKVPYSIPVAGKTGTTNDGADAWFIGFTPELVTGVWVGFDRAKRITSGSVGGALLAGPVFANFVNAVYDRRPAPVAWERPAALRARTVDQVTGYLATDFCPPAEKYTEWFVPGTEPTEFCPIHLPRFGISALPGGAAVQRHGLH